MTKSVLVHIGRSVAVADAAGREAVRMAVGLTLADNKVTVLFTGPGVGAVCGEGGMAARYLEGLELVGATLRVDRAALAAVGDLTTLRIGVEPADEEEIKQLINNSDVVIPFLESNETV